MKELELKNGLILSIDDNGNIKYRREDGEEFEYGLIAYLPENPQSKVGKYLQVFYGDVIQETITDTPI